MANKLAISAFFRCATGVKNENKKIRKKISENDFILRLKFSEKNFSTKIEKRQRSGWARQKGRRSIIALNKQYNHKTDMSRLYCPPLPPDARV